MRASLTESTVGIVVDGRRVQVSAGITVAAALFNLDVTTYRRSVKDEPRAAMCAMGTCHECRVTIDSRPQQRACLTTVADGMHIQTASAS
jgi:sarcosine oxidase subunit alpha